MYASIIYKTKGRKKILSSSYSYKRNILTLKETFILQIVDEIFTLSFVLLVEEWNYYELYCVLYITYCIIVYFIVPILLVVSLRKTLPEFESDSFNINHSMTTEFYAFCKPRSVNIEPRSPEITMKKLLQNTSGSELPLEDKFQNIPILLITSPQYRKHSKKCDKLPNIV